MASVKTRDDFCEVALNESHYWAAIEAYDASPKGSVSTELRAIKIPAPRQSFADNCSKQETNLHIDANLVNRFDVICRFCLEEKQQLMDIFGLSDNAVATVETLVDVKITYDDMLPKQICADCYEVLNQCLAFKQQVASTNTALRRCIDQLKQVEIPTKIEVVESSASEITEQNIFYADSVFNKLIEGHKFEELIEEEDCTAGNDCLEDANLFSEYIEKPVEDSGEPVTNLSRTSVYCEQYDKGFSCNSHPQRHMDSEGKIRINNQSRMCSKSFCQVTDLNGHMISNTTPNEDVKEQIKAFELTKNNASFAVEQESSVHGSKLQEDNQIESPQCSMNFSKLMQLRRHVKTHYENKPRGSKKPFQCSRCVKSFGNSSTLAVHLRTPAGKNPNKCPHCAKSFRKSCTLQKHVAMHTDEKPYKCLHCSKSFRRSDTLSRHTRTHTSEKPYKCPHCSKSFTQNANLVTHVRTHTGEKPYKCSHCSKTFRQSSTLTCHVRTHTGEKPYQCPHCSKSFRKSGALACHTRTHTSEKPYKCPHCSKSFAQNPNLVAHIRTHTGEKAYQCPHCSKSFRQSSALTDHVRTHTGEKPYQCPHCSKSFSKSSSLSDHVRTHTGGKPYKCPQCSKCFSRSSNLAVHARTHAEEKPYKCPHCSKAFLRSSNLVDHVRWHTGEKPHKCSHCCKSFLRSSDLAIHVCEHTGEKPYQYPHCSKSFRKSCTLSDYKKTHTGGKPYNCPHCSKSFPQSSNLVAHVRTHTEEK